MASIDREKLLKLIKDFLFHQRMLLRRFSEVFPDCISKNVFHRKCPREGNLDLKDQKWNYFVHGNGIRFEQLKSEIIVDSHDHTDNSDFLDAWRLYLYAKSIDEKFSFSETDIERGLHSLSCENIGLLKNKSGDYCFPEKFE